MLDRNTIHCADIFDLCGRLDPQSVDMILCDLPYGTTACSWDTVIPFAPMWDAFKRLIKPRGAIVLTASQPFTSLLVCSNLAWFRYEWIWDKLAVTGYLDANRKPLKRHESILIFSDAPADYYPQMAKGTPYKEKYRAQTPVYSKYTPMSPGNPGVRFPTSIIQFSNANCEEKEHSTEKPVTLFEYLIRTYTQPGELVFDPCVGSGTTALAARNCGRDYICGDSSPAYVAIAQRRLDAPYTLPLLSEETAREVYETKPFELEG